jgi:threonine dehydrogenase-like Zn-dependent dehydrogenase
MNDALVDSLQTRVAVLEAPRRLVFKEESIDPAVLDPGSVLCRTEVSVISPGTELAAYVGAPPLRPGVVYPRLMGYCNVARVLKSGAAVRGISPDDRVLTFSSHRSHFVSHAEDVLAVLDSAISSDDAACAYLFHLGYSAVLEANVRLGSTVVVIGLGILGLASVASAALAGARVFAVSDHARPRDLAKLFGASACFGRAELPRLLEELGPTRADVVVTTSNAWSDWPIALECAGTRASIAVLGFPGRQEETIPSNPLDSKHFYMRQLRIFACGIMPEQADSRGFLPFNERTNLRRILGWIQEGRLRPASLLSGAFQWHELQAAYERLLARTGAPLTFLLRWTEPR